MKPILKSKRSKIIAIIAASLAVVTLVGIFLPFSALRRDSGSKIDAADPGSMKTEPAYGLRNADYAALYVSDGLEACYMAYESSSLEYVKEEDALGDTRKYYSWRNYVDQNRPGELRGVNYWCVMDGGVGYRVYFDKYNKDTEYGSCVLPEEYMTGELFTTFEVETVAKLLGLTDRETGTIVKQDAPGTYRDVTTFRFGYLHSSSYLNASDATSYNNTRRWRFSKTTTANSASAASTNFYDRVFEKSGLAQDENAVTMRIKLENVASSNRVGLAYGYQGEEYSIWTNTLDYWSGWNNKTVNYTDTAPYFTLFDDYPGVLYSVRVYSRSLTDEEKVLNSFVDLLAYYEINVSSILALDEETRNNFLSECAYLADIRNIGMGNTDELIIQTERTRLKAIINECWQ